MTSLTPKKTTLYAVARNGQPINDDATADVAVARRLLVNAEEGMRSAGLEPDLELVTVERTISFGKPKRFEDPEAVAQAEDEPAEEQEPEEGAQPPAE